MKLIARNNLKPGIAQIAVLACVAALTACGGGGGAPGTQTGIAAKAPAVASPTATTINFLSVEPNNKSIVIKGAGSAGRTENAKLLFKVLDAAGNGIPQQQVTFTVFPPLVTLSANNSLTNANGEAVVNVNSGTVPTTFRVTATTSNGISTTSDAISVTTGVGVQTAFSLAVDSYNISGWSHDNEKANISVLLADASGNPVANNTFIAFQTDSGAVGTSQTPGGGCLTVDGGCSVAFRSQEPRYSLGNTVGKRAGLATVTASTVIPDGTVGGKTILGKVGIFLSGDNPDQVYVGSTRLLPLLNNSIPGSQLVRTDATSCQGKLLTVTVNDLNFNPMPAGTTVAVKNAVGLTTSSVSPDKVSNLMGLVGNDNSVFSPLDLPQMMGSDHIVPMMLPSTCAGAVPGTVAGSFDLEIKSPYGTLTTFPITIRY